MQWFVEPSKEEAIDTGPEDNVLERLAQEEAAAAAAEAKGD